MADNTAIDRNPVRVPGVPGGVTPPYPHATPFSVITMGSGAPELNPSRASACTVIQHQGSYYVVDTGNGSALNFIRGGPHGVYRPQDITAILFTHLHQDHVNDYFDLATARWGAGGKHLDLVGPPGTAELHRFLVTFFRDDLLYRRLLGGPTGVDQEGMFDGVDILELAGANEFQLGALRVTTSETTHSMYNLAYRFDAGTKSVVVSGDTAFDRRLVALARGADVLVVDANPWADGTKPPPPRLPESVLPEKLRERVPFRGDLDAPNHMSLPEVVRVTVEAGVRTVVLTHLWPLAVDRALVARTERAFAGGGFGGRVVLAEDGLEVPV
jgi:ribonuclease BN (tRNA processing enzyme)